MTNVPACIYYSLFSIYIIVHLNTIRHYMYMRWRSNGAAKEAHSHPNTSKIIKIRIL